MTTVPVMPAVAAQGHTGTDFGQDLTKKEQEFFVAGPDLVDPTINAQPLEAYMYYAKIEREREAADTRPIPDSPWTVLYKRVTGQSSKINHADVDAVQLQPLGRGQPPQITDTDREKRVTETGVEPEDSGIVTVAEREHAYRALRVASWQAVLYLITTDILGFSSAGEAFQELGFGPGVLVYSFFYLLAVIAGQIIWRLYLSYDSPMYPVTCYADLGERTFGRKVRHIFNFFQSFQLVFNVALLIIGNGQTLVAMIQWKFCYLALNIFFMLIGMVGGQIRSLRDFAWFANVNVWLNMLTMIITIIGSYMYPPVPSESNHADLSQPIQTAGWVPGYTNGWYQQVGGVQLAVFAYGGAMIFPEFMAEMRRPRDFWKAALGAQLFCYLIYMMFGLLLYAKQGQYTSILPGLNFDNQAFILANNIFGLITIMVAAVLYGNIGVKVFYQNVLREYFHAPPMFSQKGRWYWSATVIAYWAIAWLIGSAIPSINALVTLVGAACILQFTYTFPPILALGYWVQIDAGKADNPWAPGMAAGSNRIDSWRDKSRWVRGFKKYWYVKVFLFLVFLAAWANCALGIYAGIETAIAGYKGAYNIPFSCTAPNDPKVQPASSG